MLSITDIVANYSEIGRAKANYPLKKTILFAILAGAFIALAAGGSMYAVHDIESIYVGKIVAGALFATGLILVVLSGVDLFTGNTLIAFALYDKRVSVGRYFKNLGFVWIANFVGSMIVVGLFIGAGNLHSMGWFAIKTAATKTDKTFFESLCSGILCCWLVAMAVFCASGSKSAIGKIFAVFFPIWLFIASGYEHSIANMFYIPLGLIAKLDPNLVAEALQHGVAQSAIDGLNFGTFIGKNLIPVTIGNLIGGAVLVALVYWVALKKKHHKTATELPNDKKDDNAAQNADADNTNDEAIK